MNIPNDTTNTETATSRAFPLSCTEAALIAFARKPVRNQTNEEYRKLLNIFITEYAEVILEEPFPANLVNPVLDYLTEENQPEHLIWYHTLIHQSAYFFRYGQFDMTDLNYTTLTNIVRHPEEYVNVQSNEYVLS